ncbi:MAG: pantoate--beta-alanine ligase [Armatimonadetes bacterium]|nr:pantoate--beta-alanine ligase [Armatimonadota bacterium]
MKIARSVAEVRASGSTSCGFVPTMGAFHEGHLSLMRAAKADCGFCAVSLFVNPTQFGPHEDYTKYPRDEANDIALAEAAGCDLLFIPAAEEIYAGDQISVSVGSLADVYEGYVRPGHFNGVATVVSKLIHIFEPKVAYFGQKDLQQCAVIRALFKEQFFNSTLRILPTMREPNGLALSSRNRYLTPEQIQNAGLLNRVLRRIAGSDDAVETAIKSGIQALQSTGWQVDYLDLVDFDTFEPLIHRTERGAAIGAARLGNTRLIDNVLICDDFFFAK